MELITSVKGRLAELKKQIKDQPYLFPHLADCYLLLSKPRLAAKTLLKGLEQFPDNPLGWLVKGNLHVKLNQPKQAMTAFKQVLKLDSDISYAHEKCADLAWDEGNSEWHIYHLQEINRLEPLDDEIRRKMDIEIMKRIAVEKGLFSRKVINDVKPEILRRTIIDRNLLPSDMKRKDTRPEAGIPKLEYEEESFDPFADIMQPPEPEEIVAKEEDILEETEDKLEIEDEIELGAWADHIDENEEKASGRELDDLLNQTIQEASAPLDNQVDDLNEADVTVVKAADEEEIFDESDSFEDDTQTEQDDHSDYSSEDDVENESEDSVAEDDDNTRKSPLMKMLAGEMIEQPASREVNFFKEDDDSHIEKPNLAAQVLKAKGSSNISLKMKVTSMKDEESMKKHEDDQDRIAEIARHVMHPAIKSGKESTTENEIAVANEELVESDSGKIDFQDSFSEIKDLVDDVLPHKEKEMSEKRVGRVPTKTLAELYLSQGNLKSSIEVYEELVKLHPGNKTFAERLQELNVRLVEEEENKEG
jgi:tetratricopeptide (TPR) repeat protein